MGWIIAALATAIGAGGWAFAIFFMLSADDMRSELTTARAELSKTKAEQSTLAIYSRSIYGGRDFGVNRERIDAWLTFLREGL